MKIPSLFAILLAVVCLVLGLFHFVGTTRGFTIVPKASFSFSDTFTSADVVLQRYNNRSWAEVQRGDAQLDNLVRKLEEKRYIFSNDSNSASPKISEQEHIDNTKVKELAADFKIVPVFISSYWGKFNALPGDDSAAATHLSGATNATTPVGMQGNGVINGIWNTNIKTDESYLLWQHVRLAGLAPGEVNKNHANYIPKNAVGGIIGVQSGGAATPIINLHGSYIICSSGIAGKFAKQLDTSLDDGDPTTGSVMITASSTSPAAATYITDDNDNYTVCMGVDDKHTAAITQKEAPDKTMVSGNSYNPVLAKRIAKAAKTVVDIVNKEGMSGLISEVEDCYDNNESKFYCIELDFASRYLDRAFIAATAKRGMSFPETEFFNEQTLGARIEPVLQKARLNQEQGDAYLNLVREVIPAAVNEALAKR